MTRPVEVSIAATPTGQTHWTDLARRCEAIGARALLVPDHPGVGPSPFVALAGAASVTSTLRLSSYVANAGVRHPLLLAGDVATLDIVSDGRAELGIGAGHTAVEWQMTGRDRPEPRDRVAEFVRVANATRALLDGDTVTGTDIGALTDVRLESPRPAQERVPILAGGGHPALLAWAGAHADAVGLSGLGRTLPDGHSHDVRWSAAQTTRQVGRVRDAAASADVPTPPIEALVQFVRETPDRHSVASEIAERVNAPIDDVLGAPYVLVGTIDQIVEQLGAAQERWGISRWAVRDDALETAERIVARLA